MGRRAGNLITIGSFDGVHRGHWTLLDKTVLEAKKRNLVPMALTFEIPPRMVIHKYPDPSVLTTPHEKEWLIRERDIEKVESIDFDSEFANQKSYYFFKYGLLQKYRAKGIVVGLDFHFGIHRSGSVYDLVRWGQDFGIPVWVLPQFKWRGEVASSSWIRTLLQAKRYKECMEVMGHPYSIFGQVVNGRGVGKNWGFQPPIFNWNRTSFSRREFLSSEDGSCRRNLEAGIKKGAHFWGCATSADVPRW